MVGGGPTPGGGFEEGGIWVPEFGFSRSEGTPRLDGRNAKKGGETAGNVQPGGRIQADGAPFLLPRTRRRFRGKTANGGGGVHVPKRGWKES